MTREHAPEVIGLDHVYLTVRDFERSEAWYDGVMRALGFYKGDRAIAGDVHAHYFNRALQVTIRPARLEARHDAYAPGLHHLCLQLRDRDDVDEAERRLRALGVEIAPAAEYPEYNDDYYAIFFEDPDGLRHELIARSRTRRSVATRWDELSGFLNPWAALMDRDRARDDASPGTAGGVEIRRADLRNPAHADAALELIGGYASEPIGGGQPLPEATRRHLSARLLDHPTTHVWLAWSNGRADGVALCFLGFSSFAARPLLNIHDLAVRSEVRGRGIGRQLLAAVESGARDLGCCRLTLEVRDDNDRARGLYQSFGFGFPDAQRVGVRFVDKPLL